MLTTTPTCATCRQHRRGWWGCSHVDCPHRKPGTAYWGPVAFPNRHDGLGWDRFYHGQRKPPEPGEELP